MLVFPRDSCESVIVQRSRRLARKYEDIICCKTNASHYELATLKAHLAAARHVMVAIIAKCDEAVVGAGAVCNRLEKTRAERDEEIASP